MTKVVKSSLRYTSIGSQTSRRGRRQANNGYLGASGRRGVTAAPAKERGGD